MPSIVAEYQIFTIIQPNLKKKIMTEVMIKRKNEKNEGWWQDRENESRERGWRMIKK